MNVLVRDELRAILARTYAEILRPGMRDALEWKADRSILTAGDRAAHKLIRAGLSRRFPLVPIVSEEDATPRIDGQGRSFVIDPIDGSEAYCRGYPNWAISICMVKDNIPTVGAVLSGATGQVTDAIAGEGCFQGNRRLTIAQSNVADREVTCIAARNVPLRPGILKSFADAFWSAETRLVTPALGLAQVAAGELDGVLFDRLMPWDIAAGVLLVREAGGVVDDLLGNPFTLDSSALIAGRSATAKRIGVNWRELVSPVENAT